MRRRKGLACSMALDPNSSSRQELKGEVYNIFPFIYDPKGRAFTLPSIIDAIFLPFKLEDEEEKSQRRTDTVCHEIGHIILSSATVTCEERAEAARLLASVWNLLIDTDKDVQLLIPSFTIVGPAGKSFELQRLADQLEELADAREAVHETVARTVEFGDKDWNRNKVKEHIRKVVTDDLLDKKALDDFLYFYEMAGPIGAFLLGHYALNTVDLTKQSALARFKRAIEVAGTFKLKRCSELTGPSARLMDYLQFLKHLDSNLPDYIMARCPLAGCNLPCLPSFLDSRADRLI